MPTYNTRGYSFKCVRIWVEDHDADKNALIAKCGEHVCSAPTLLYTTTCNTHTTTRKATCTPCVVSTLYINTGKASVIILLLFDTTATDTKK